jgi:hypothetical protein
VSLVFHFFLIFLSIQLINFICFQEQGRRNDLYSKCVSPVPQDLMSTPGISKNIKSDSVHCDPLSCVASGSRCHTADYLKEMKDVDSSVPCLNSSILKSPAVSTNIKSDSVHCDPLSCVASGSRCHTADYLNVTKGVDASIPDLTINPGRMPPFHQKWGCDHVWSCKMDRMGGVGSPLAGFWMGLGERPPHQPFPVLFDRLVWSKIRKSYSYVGHGMFLFSPAKKNSDKCVMTMAAAETAPIRWY